MKVIILLTLVLLLGVNCSLKAHHPSRRIVAGSVADTGDYKFQVAIIYKRKFGCSGTIISSNAVITTAACSDTKGLNVPLSAYTILAGTHDLKGAGHMFEIQKIHRHPKYKFGLYDYDIAIFETKDSMLDLNDTNIGYVQMNYEPLPENAVVTISGWGAIGMTGSRHSQHLRYATVKLIHWNECLHKFPLETKLRNPNGAFCTIGNKTESLCWRDQGGPVVYQGKILLGVSVMGLFCQGANVHIEIKNHLNWIGNVLNSF